MFNSGIARGPVWLQGNEQPAGGVGDGLENEGDQITWAITRFLAFILSETRSHWRVMRRGVI